MTLYMLAAGGCVCCGTMVVMSNWFTTGGQQYHAFRPTYPAGLARKLAQLAPQHNLAVDVGCGNGQFTTELAPYFETVIGVDPAIEMLRHAERRQNVNYVAGAAEGLPLAQGCGASLITAAQAANWFDLASFYAQVRRIAAPGALLALISYGRLRLDAVVDERFQYFYDVEIGPFWPPEREHVNQNYATLAFPFQELPAAQLGAWEIVREWTFAEFIGYVGTWSATKRAFAAGRQQLVEKAATEMASLWGDLQQRRRVVWPLAMRACLLEES